MDTSIIDDSLYQGNFRENLRTAFSIGAPKAQRLIVEAKAELGIEATRLSNADKAEVFRYITQKTGSNGADNPEPEPVQENTGTGIADLPCPLLYCEGPVSNTKLQPGPVTYAQFAEYIKAPVLSDTDSDDDKAQGAYLVRCQPKQAGAGVIHRADESMAGITVAIIDADKHIEHQTGELLEGAPGIDDIAGVLQGIDVGYVGYTSYSHNPDAGINKSRFLLPVSRVITPWEAGAVNAWLLAHMHSKGVMLAPASESNTMSQPWFLPRVPASRADHYESVSWFDGNPLDVDGIVKWFNETHDEAAPEAAESPKTETGGDGVIDFYNDTYGAMETVFVQLEAAGFHSFRAATINGYPAWRGYPDYRSDGEGMPGAVLYYRRDGKKVLFANHHTTGNTLNERNTQTGKPLAYDAFDVVTRTVYNGDEGEAYKWAATQKAAAENPAAATPAPALPGMQAEWVKPEELPEMSILESEPFPVEILPDVIRNAAAEIGRFTKAPEIAAISACMSAVAVAIGKKARIEERAGLCHYPALIMAILAKTGERKSPVFKSSTKALSDYEADKQAAYEHAVKFAAALDKSIDLKIKALDKQKDLSSEDYAKARMELENQRQDDPVSPQLFTDDVTPEMLTRLLYEHGGQFGVMSAEGRDILDNIIGRYSSGSTGDSVYLKGVSGDTIKVNRVGNDKTGRVEISITEPCLNTCIFVQPDKYAEMLGTPALRESGLVARVLAVSPESLVGTRTIAANELDYQIDRVNPFHELVTKILAEPVNPETGPVTITMTTDVREAWRLYHNWVEIEMKDAGSFEDARDVAAKAASNAVKLALILQILAAPDIIKTGGSVSLAVWEVAEKLGRYYLNESARMIAVATEAGLVRVAKEILEFIDAHDIATRTDKPQRLRISEIDQHGPHHLRRHSRMEEALELLCDHGYIRPVKQAGSRKPAYEINPLM